jgi:SAM-dependent methyltransferase
MQIKQSEWLAQWVMLRDDEQFLFLDWIQPYALDVFSGKDVLECGCGGGQHTDFMSPYAKTITAVDLNTTQVAMERNKQHSNVTFVEADIASMNLGRKFDIAISIGVVHHTDNPENTVANMMRHLKEGGLLLLWVYSEEGNWMVRNLVEPVRQSMLKGMSRRALLALSRAITALMYVPIYTIYLLPLPYLPYFEYFKNFRRLSFYRNVLNVFDKLNAPQTDFISKSRAIAMTRHLAEAQVIPYRGVSWSISGRKVRGFVTS